MARLSVLCKYRPLSSRRRRARLLIEELEPRNVPSTLAAPYTPTQVQNAYGFGQLGLSAKGATIAIVDAYNDPNIVRDLSTFDSTFGLQQFNVKGGPTLNVVNQTGGAALPASNASWDLEIALDVEWAHAIAPQANIVLVEASNSNTNNLFTAVQYAAAHANVVSMSWGTTDFSGEQQLDSVFASYPNVTFVASSGDTGTVSWPSVSSYVLSVGGTSLTINSNGTYASETAWKNSYGSSGGGASKYEPAPSYQQGITGSSFRVTPDVAYNADPNTGIYVYDSVPYQGQAGWYEMGGTSAGAPQWAGLIALADQTRTAQGLSPLGTAQTLTALYSLYNTPSYALNFHDVTTGSNTNGYSAKVGYDGVTGLGSPVANNLVPYLGSYTGTTTSLTKTGSTTSSPSNKPTTRHDDGVLVLPPITVISVAPTAAQLGSATTSTAPSTNSLLPATGAIPGVSLVGTAALPSSGGVESRSTGAGGFDSGIGFWENGPAVPVVPPISVPPELLPAPRPAPAMPENPRDQGDPLNPMEEEASATRFGELGGTAVLTVLEETDYRAWRLNGSPATEIAVLAAAFTGWWGMSDQIRDASKKRQGNDVSEHQR